MDHHPIISGCLLGAAATVCVLCAVGLLVMRDAYQRLHFSSPIVSIGIALIVAAVWVEDPQWQSRIKAVLIAIILFLTNATLSHATARAIRLRDLGHWAPRPDEQLPLVSTDGKPIGIAGAGAQNQ
jgi:monovalent cation/proton antiporter MnhG/PhaG subunit